MEFQFNKFYPDFANTKNKRWVGIFASFLAFIIIAGMLVINERNEVRKAEDLEEIKGNIIAIDSGYAEPQNNTKVVHASAMLSVSGALNDTLFNMQAHAVKLKRTVSMYQWKEVERRRSGSGIGRNGSRHVYTTYEYIKVWSPVVINSQRFQYRSGHENFLSIPFGTREFIAADVGFGAFKMSKSLLEKLKNYEPLPITQTIFDGISVPEIKSQYKLVDGILYKGQDPNKPKIGDIKIEFSIVRPSVVSIIARQVDSSFAPYTSEKGRSLEFIMPGKLSEDEMVSVLYQENSFMVWALRLLGLFSLWIIFTVFFNLFLFKSSSGWGHWAVPLMVALSVTLIIIALCWVFFEPLLTLILGAVAGLILLFARKLVRKRATEEEVPYN